MENTGGEVRWNRVGKPITNISKLKSMQLQITLLYFKLRGILVGLYCKILLQLFPKLISICALIGRICTFF